MATWRVSVAVLRLPLVNVSLYFALDVCLLKYDLTIFETLQTSK